MNTFTRILITLTLVASMATAGCASSYQDRLDALSGPDDGAGDAASTDGMISPDEIVHSGACIVNADCPSDKHCHLGACFAECGAEESCAEGLLCSQRGKCVDSADYIDVDGPIKTTPPVSWALDKRVVRLDPGVSSSTVNLKVGNDGPLQYRVEVQPSNRADAITLSSTQGVVASGGQLGLTVGIDRSAFGVGDHRIVVNVISDGGSQLVAYEFSNGLSGRYAGFVDYQNPGLGRIPIVVDIDVDEGGDIIGRIVSDASLFFPEERSISGHYDKVQGLFFFETSDLYEAGGEFDPFERDIGREVYFFGEISEQRVIKGTFEEIISALFPQLLSVDGEFYLKRVDMELGAIDVLPAPTLPAFPPVNTSFSVCHDPAEACDVYAGSFAVDMMGCSSTMRASAFQLGVDFVGTDAGGEPMVNFGLVEECGADVSGQGTNACVDIAEFTCLRNNQQYYLLDNIAQASEFRTYFEDLMGYQRLYSFIGNDMLVEAYRTSIQTVSSPLMQELMHLENALEKYGEAEHAFFETENIAIMGRATSPLIAENSFEVLRVPIEYMRSSHAALKRIANLTMRKDIEWPSKKDELRTRIQEHARIIFLEGLALARLVHIHGGSFESELAQVADELRSVTRTATTLEAGLNPLGYPVDYVPFVYDPTRSQYPTNFSQLVQTAQTIVTSAVQKAQLANQTAQEMEVRTEEIQQQMLEIEQSYESELLTLCGSTALDDLSECGENGGQVAAAASAIEEQFLEIAKLEQQVMDVHQMVNIKEDTAQRIIGVKEDTLAFIESTGAELETQDIAEGDIRAAMLRSNGLFGSIGGFLGGALSFGAGLASAALGNPVGGSGIAGGLSGMVNAGLGMASSAQSATAAKQFARVAQRKDRLKTLQQMRYKEEEIAITDLQATEAVKSMLLQLGQIGIDLEAADIRLNEKTINFMNLLERVDYLAHQRDVLMDQALNSVNNPLSNLSFRIKRDHAVLVASNEFEKALAYVYLAARGLEHELNVELPQIESLLFQVNSAQQLQDFLTCLSSWYDDYAIAFGSPHQEVTQLSLREDVLRFTEPETDAVTGELIQPQEIFRRVLLNPQHITQSGAVEFPFVTSVAGASKNFSTLVCNDRVKSVRVMLVGDFLGDNEATVMLKQVGDSYLRDCSAEPLIEDDILTTYHLDERTAVVQAGVNDFGLASPNYDLAGRSVASDRWVLIIPPGTVAPSNADIDLLNIDDVVIEITHQARSLNGGSPTTVFSQCNL